MSLTKVFAIEKDTVRRSDVGGGDNEGCGNSKHLYVGRYGSRDYDSFLKFTLNWSDVAKIVSATLNLYTDEYNTYGFSGEPGIMPAPGSSDRPRVLVRRLTSAFTEGDNADGHFDPSDYTNPSRTTSSETSKYTVKGANLLTAVDITAIVRAWAPSTVSGGGKASNHGIGLYGFNDTALNWSGWAMEHGNSAERPSITLVYELGSTVPNAPSNMTPAGAQPSLATFEGDFSDVRATDTLQSTNIEIYDVGKSCTTATDNFVTTSGHGLVAGDSVYFTSVTSTNLTAFTRYYVIASGLTTSKFKVSTTLNGTQFDITDAGSGTWSRRLSAPSSRTASQSEKVAAHFVVPKPTDFVPRTGVTYRWRAKCVDQEGQASAWSSLVSFSLTNTAPNPPILSPSSGSSYASLNLVRFEGGTFSDPDGDALMAHQTQLSIYPSGDIGWEEADNILWDSGKAFDPSGSVSWTEMYGGRALTAGTYYWRARQWDTRDGVSVWTYGQIILTADFSPDPGNYDNVQVNPVAPWRILIRNLYQSDGVTKTAGRGPGQLVAVLEEAKNIGASVVYNSPGEIHFTLLKDDPQIAVIEPKQTHYAVEFYSGDGWQEKYAGVIWDVDVTDTDVVFKGLDYLALYDTVVDERYDPLKPNQTYTAGGSFYPNVTIRTVILDQLNRAKALADSWVGFIAIGSVATMDERVTVYSTMQPVLSFVAGLIDSHRQGTGKRTRAKVVKTTTGTYQLQIVDEPGTIRNDLAMYYGELVQGYRLIVFGDAWANVEHVVGRNRDGAKVVYQTISGKPFQPSTSTYGRVATVAVMDGVQDQIDLNRRGLQAAVQSAKLGKNVAIGIRTQYVAPLQGWDVCDVFPLRIVDGALDTDALGSGYWAAYAAAWEATDIGQQSLVITFMPREDTSAPDPDLLKSQPISTQPEWQLGWTPPDPLKVSSKYYLDQTTGIVYEQQPDGTYLPTASPIHGAPFAPVLSSAIIIDSDGGAVVRLTVTFR
jgi:hypothetical protein